MRMQRLLAVGAGPVMVPLSGILAENCELLTLAMICAVLPIAGPTPLPGVKGNSVTQYVSELLPR